MAETTGFTSNQIGGITSEFNSDSFAEALTYYYQNPDIRLKDGQQLRQNILSDSKYQWPEVGKKLSNFIQTL